MEPSANAKNIYQRMIEVQKKVQTVIKADTVSYGNESYKAVSHDDVALLLHMPLAECGIVLLPEVKNHKFSEFQIEKGTANNKYIQRWYRCDLEINVKWVNADKPDDFIQSSGAAFALDTSDKCFSKAYSLALKIILLKVHLLESRDKEEERTFEKGEPSASNAPPKKTAPPPAAKPPLKNHANFPEQKKDPHPPIDPPTEALQYLYDLVEKKKLPPEYVKTVIKKVTGKEKRANSLPIEELEAVIDYIQKSKV